ncbi:hypothetical protein BaRGS_00014967 [Batillaria attramentaria]|uniref:Uncharacterized protein n=1 Tax=Batillaria attramentaria TaxID=370345 RepID=A0ABD0L2S7_9CAEN
MAKLLLNTDRILILIVLLTDVIVVQGQTQEGNESNSVRNNFQMELTQKLFTNRSLVVPPYSYNADSSFNPINVSIDTFIFSISGLDLRHQQFTFVGLFVLRYTDPSLSWDTAVYPVDAIFVKPEDIWTPDLFVMNSVMPFDQLVKKQMMVVVYANGSVTWSPGDTITTTCYVDIQLFPFDSQTCTVIVSPWVYFEHQVNCTDTVLSLPEVQSAEWDITETSHRIKRSSGENGKSWHIVYTVKLRRKWLFYALNVLLPVLLVSGLNSVVFALPVQCGEKMSVSLTTFLTLAVFMTLIQDSLPSNSDTVCYLAVYLASQMVLSVAAVVVSAVTVACHHRQPKEENSTQNIRPMSSADATDSSATVADRSEVKPEAVDWQRLGVVIDRICFPVFTGLSVLSFLIYGIVTAL